MSREKKSLIFPALLTGVISLSIFGCASIMKYEKADNLKQMKEFDDKVKIESPADPESGESAATPAPAPVPAPSPTPPPLSAKELRKKRAEERRLKRAEERKLKNVKKAAGVVQKALPAVPAVDLDKHEPELEGQDGFKGRRPLKDPFRAGESIEYEVSYFNMKAGEATLSVKPFATVNGRKNYDFRIALKTASVFDRLFSVDDTVRSLVDFENMQPTVYTLHVKQSDMLKETRFYVDQSKNHAFYWEKKVTKSDGEQEKKYDWEVPDYSQDVMSSIFYVRAFEWKVGETHAFRVADNEENLVFKGKALRRETLNLDVGTFPTIVIKPDIELHGKLKNTTDLFIWMSDDDHHYILKIEAKPTFGTLVFEATKIVPGEAGP